jgi:hypothetical protein
VTASSISWWKEDHLVTTQPNWLNGELQQQIREFQAQMLPKIPKEILTTFESTTNDLIKTGIAERALHEGAKAPDFTLPNAKGQQVKFFDILTKGPAVVTFYRGGW